MCEYESRDKYHRCGRICSSDEVSVMEMEQRDSVVGTLECNNQNWEDYMNEGKAFQISQNEVLNAYKAVKANKGAGGVDGIEFQEFDRNWKNRLYVLWNRMSSGSYYPKPVKGVEIPKDSWMTVKYSKCPWERYADDGIIHCVSRKQAEFVLDMLKEQMKRYRLTIHPEKSNLVFCRRNNEPVPKEVETSFVFLGYCIRLRLVKSTQGIAVSVDAARSFRKKIRMTIRKAGTTDIIILSQMLNPIIRGWMNYFCKFTPSEAFQKGINYVNQKLVRWIRKNRKKAKRSYRKAQTLLKRIALSNPKMFYQWQAGYMPM